MIRFRALGALDLRRSDGTVVRSVLAQPKRLALLAYLTIARPRGFHRRDRLVAMFWPDSSEDRARAALNRALYFLRQQLGDDVIVSRGDEEVAVDTARFQCDVTEFEDAAERGFSRQALDVYHGDLLPGFFAPDANDFDDWLEGERIRLRTRASQSAWALAGAAEGNGDTALAIMWARRAVDLAPFNEPELRRLLLLLDAAGDRAGAADVYQRFVARLAEQLELEPAPETQALIAEIQSREFSNGSGKRAAPPNGDTAPKPASPAVPVPRGTSRRWAIAAAALLIVATTPALLLARVNRRNLDQRRIYVARFANLTGDAALDPLGQLAADRVAQAVNATGLLELAAPAALGEAVLAAGRGTHPAALLRAANQQHAGLLVTGEIQRNQETITIQAWITDVAHDRVVWAIAPESAPHDSLQRAIDEVQARATSAVVVLNTPRFATWFPLASSAPRFSAFQEFAKGVDLQIHGAAADAIDHLRKAVALDSTFILARLRLAEAHYPIYREDVADSIALSLNASRERLMPLQRHLLDYLLALRVEDRLGAYRAISDAAALAPGVFLFTQADWAFRLNRPREAVELLERLGPDSPYDREVEYWDALTRAYHALGDRHRELNAARQARRRYPDRIDALTTLLKALAAQGKAGEVNALLDSARAFPRPRPGPQGVVVDMPGAGKWPGRLMMAAALEFRAHGFDSAATEAFGKAVEWYRTPEQADVPQETHEFELARALYNAREWTAAAEKFKALAAADTSNVIYQGFLGTVAARVGDTLTARAVLANFERWRPGLVRPHAIAGYWIGKINGVLGDEAGAMRGLREAFGYQGRTGLVHENDFERLRNSRDFREFIRPKDER